MSVISYNTLKALGKAYQLKTDRDIDMFNDLWEVYQVGNKYRRDQARVLHDAVARSYDTLTSIVQHKVAPANAAGFRRVGIARNDRLVIFSDHHMTHRGHRHDYFFTFNYPLYCEVLRHYADRGFALVENGDMEELVIFEPTPEETRRRRNLVKKPLLGLDDIGQINWDELVGLRIESRRKQLEKILNDNHTYYQLVQDRFGMSRFYKIGGNHDGYYARELESMLESALWDGVVKDIVLVERPGEDRISLDFAILHGHQFDEACVPPHAKAVGEVISECLAWAFQGADRIWRISDTRKWNSHPIKAFNNVLSRTDTKTAITSGHPDLEVLLESFMGHQVAWEYFENTDPYLAFVKEVCTGDEFFKYRHLDENALANAMLHWQADMQDFPTIICGHSHEPRDHAQFLNSQARLSPGTKDPNIFTRYMNTGSAGRFENLIWCIEITGSTAHVYSWSNAGTTSKITMRKVCWDSDLQGKLIGKEVDIPRA